MKLKTISASEAQNWPSRYRAHFFNCLSGFKPLHLLGTRSQNKQNNLAVFSQVFHIGANPPFLGVLFRPDTVERHTLKNIRETGFFTLNHVPTSHVEQAHHTAAKFADNESEFEKCGFTPLFNETFWAPFVEESPVRMGLSLHEIIEIKANNTLLLVGKIEEVHYPEMAVKEDGYLDLNTLNVACCTGMDAYHSTDKIARFAYAEPDKKTEDLPDFLFWL